MITVQSALFIKSSQGLKDCPKNALPEFAFIGRSNVGKSSLINMITGWKGLAKTSGTPGKTQLINHFLINEQWYLVDLPGLGYARVSQKSKAVWNKMIFDFLEKSPYLKHTFVLLDSRLEPQKIDLEFIHFLVTKEIPFSVVFTKIDKLTKNELNKQLQGYSKTFLRYWAGIPEIYVSSADKKVGREELLNVISNMAE